MYKVDTRVAFSDVDSFGYLSISGLMRKLQDCCALQSEDIGYGLSWLQERGLGWYVISWQVHIHRLPFMGDAVSTKTMPYLFKGYFGNRNFTIETMDGEVLVEVNSIWILMDLKNDCPFRIPHEMVTAYGIDAPLPIEWPGRKILVPDERKKEYEFAVSPMHCDTNFHMNNTYYVDAAFACLPQDVPIREFCVEYKKPAHLHDTVCVTSADSTEGKRIALESPSGEVYASVLVSLGSVSATGS